MMWFEIILVIVLIVCGVYIWYKDELWAKKCSKEKKDAYLEGWKDAQDSLSNFDINSYLDTKYQNYTKK